ncbi:MAG: hypothetical protein ACRD98_00960 [Nitrososphaera sp.]
MKTLNAIQRNVLIEGLDDYVGLWELAGHVRDVYGPLSNDTVREMVLGYLQPLISDKLIEAGFPKKDGTFSYWSLNPEATIERISVNWQQLDRDPNLGEIVWFKNTKRGDTLARTFVTK